MDAIGNRSLRDLLQEQAQAYGERVFLIHETADGTVSELTFSQLEKTSLKLAQYFQSLGLRKGDKVFVFLKNTPDFVPIWFGLLSAGLVMVPGNIYLTEAEVEYQLQHCQPSLVITESQHLPLMRQAIAGVSLAPTIHIESDIIKNALAIDGEASLPELSGDDLGQVLYTSGTSARPKGVMLTHANFLWCGFSSAMHSSFNVRDRVFNNKPLFHANCQDTVLSCLTAGATVILGERYSATKYIQQLIRHRATVCSLSGMLCRTLLNQPASELDRAHSIRFAGYAINISSEEINLFIERFSIPIRNGYGQSEAMLYLTLQTVSAPSTYPSIGRPCLDREIYIVDDNNQLLDCGAIGEIVVKGRPGRNLMSGYLNDDAATAAAFSGGWLHTGDMGYFDAKGNLYFYGRKKEVIKRSGENISAAEVEEIIVSHPSVIDVAVIGVPDPIRDQAVMAYVVLKEGDELGEDALQAFCSERLAYFKIPTVIRYANSLPRNASGKIMKRDLLEQYNYG